MAKRRVGLGQGKVCPLFPFNAQDVMTLAAYASRTENMDAIDGCVVACAGGPENARAGIQLLDFKPFNPVDKRTEATYVELSSGQVKRATKGMTGIIIEICTRNKTSEMEDQLERDVEEFARRGLRALAVAFEEVKGNSKEKNAEGTGFELIGLLAIFDPPRDDTSEAKSWTSRLEKELEEVRMCEEGKGLVARHFLGWAVRKDYCV